MVQGAGRAGVLERARDRGDPLIGGDRISGRELPAGQARVSRAFRPGFHPRLPLALLGPPPGGGRVQPQHHRLHRRPQLPGRHRPRDPGEPHRHRGRRDIAEPGQLSGEHHRPGPVDPPFQQRLADRREAGQVAGQAQQRVGGPAGQHQRRRQLRRDMLIGQRRTRPLRGADPPVIQLGHRGQLDPGLPRRQPPRRPQHPDQLIIGQPAQALVQRALGEPGQRRPRPEPVQHPALSEPAPEQPRRLARPTMPGLRAGARAGGVRIQPQPGDLLIQPLIQLGQVLVSRLRQPGEFPVGRLRQPGELLLRQLLDPGQHQIQVRVRRISGR